MTQVKQWAQDLTEEVFGKSELCVGAKVEHPDGRMVKITEGQFWGDYGVSNFWYWREVMPDGSLSKKEEHGYGWQ